MSAISVSPDTFRCLGTEVAKFTLEDWFTLIFGVLGHVVDGEMSVEISLVVGDKVAVVALELWLRFVVIRLEVVLKLVDVAGDEVAVAAAHAFAAHCSSK